MNVTVKGPASSVVIHAVPLVMPLALLFFYCGACSTVKWLDELNNKVFSFFICNIIA